MLREKLKRFSYPLVVVFFALFLAGCTHDNSENTQEDNSDSTVTVIDGENEPDDTSDDTSTDETTTDDTTDDETDPVEEEPEEEDTADDTPVQIGESLTGATSADGAKVVGYEYEISGSKMLFSWIVGGSESKPTPSVSGGFNADGELVVTFPSLATDSLISTLDKGDEDEIELGFGLPNLTWERSGEKSTYTFATSAESSFTFRTGENEDGKDVVILELSL